MRNIERDLERILTRLRNLIRERGFTQMEVQETLGWGRSYISQLLTKQKSVRFEQVLMILNVVNADPAEFFGEIYQLGERPAAVLDFPRRGDREVDDVGAELRRLGRLYEGLVAVLKQKKLISASDLAEAIKKSRALAL
ncbi:MAG: helix-turn-helix transcriptional regulator [bacterium]|nr:helix-turn-helix transcriptional regulator [bacterium]